MKNKLHWIDLIICTGWVFCILANRHAFGSGLELALVLIIVFLRLSLSFDLVHNEKKTWLPLNIFSVAFITLFYNLVDMGFGVITRYPFWILNIAFNRIASAFIGITVFLWLLLYPILVYMIALFKKKLVTTELRWTDLMGSIIWTDKRGLVYSKLLLVLIGTLFAGLAMNMRICLFMTLVGPTLSFAIVSHSFGFKSNKSTGLLLLAMLVFFFAQAFAGIYRVGLLALSFIVVCYCCFKLYKVTHQFMLSLLSIVYLGVLLPSAGIGNNQYTCIDYGRRGFYSVPDYHGVFYVKDVESGLVGLRDRYGLILKPEYEHIVNNHRGGGGFWNQVLELRRDGYTQLFDLNNTRILKTTTINDSLQKEIGKIAERYILSEKVECQEGCEIKVTELSSNNTLSWVRVLNYGNPLYLYESSKIGELADDFDELPINTFVRNSLKDGADCSVKTINYVFNMPNDSLPAYRIGIKLSVYHEPDTTVIVGLKDKIKLIENLKFSFKPSH